MNPEAPMEETLVSDLPNRVRKALLFFSRTAAVSLRETAETLKAVACPGRELKGWRSDEAVSAVEKDLLPQTTV